MKKLFNPLVMAALVVFASACQKVERIELKPTEVKLGEAGQAAALSATALSADGKPVEKVKFEFSSSDEKVATVDASGKVSAVKSGKAIITVKASEKSATAAVDVSIPATIAVKGAPFTLTGVGSSATVEAEVQDEIGRAVSEAKMEFSSSDANIVKVEGNSLQAVAPGTTSVEVTSGSLKQSFDVTVKMPDVAALAFEAVPASLKVGESAALVVVAKGTDEAPVQGVPVSFTSSNDKIATVDAGGKVTAVKAGSVSITAASGDKKAEARLTIKKK